MKELEAVVLPPGLEMLALGELREVPEHRDLKVRLAVVVTVREDEGRREHDCRVYGEPHEEPLQPPEVQAVADAELVEILGPRFEDCAGERVSPAAVLTACRQARWEPGPAGEG